MLGPSRLVRALVGSGASAFALFVGCAHGGDVDADSAANGSGRGSDAGRDGARDGALIASDAAVPEIDAATSGSDAGAGTDGAGSDASTTTACTQALAALKFSFDTGPDGFTHEILDNAQSSGASWPFDPWAQGTPSNAIGCASGQCWATELSQNYAQCQRAALVSPVMDLTACAAEDISVTFQHAYSFWSGAISSVSYYDGGVVEISKDGGATWAVAGPYTYPGTVKINPQWTSSYACVAASGFHVDQKPGFVQVASTWHKETIPIVAAYRTASFKVRFAFGSGVSSQTTSASTSRSATAPGWHIDDVAIE